MDAEKEIDECLEDWVNQQSDHTCIALSARIALWVLPIAVREGRLSQLDDTLALRAMRYVQLAMVASVDNGMDLRRTAYRLNFHIGKGDASFAAIGAANFARRSVAATSDDPPSVAEQMNTDWRGTPQFLLLQAYLAARRARGAIWSDQGEYSELTAFERLPDRSGVPDPVSLHKTQLVPFAAEPVGRERRVGHYLHQRNGPWSFWSRWYERAMAGDPLPWHLQREIALIDDEVWEQGPKAVAEQIVEIEAEWRRKQAQVTADQARSLMRQAKAHVLQASGLQPLVQMAIDAYRREVSNQLPDALEPLEQLPPILNEIANILSADQPATEKEADLQKVLSLMAGTVSTLNQKLRDANAEIGALKQAQDDASPRRLFAEAFYTKAGEGAAGLLTSKVMWGGVLSVSALFLGTDADALVSSLGECAQTVIEQNSPSEAVAPAIQLPPLQ